MKVKLDGTKYSRDLQNMALVCNDLSEVRKYEAEMARLAENRARDEEINILKNELSEIKSLIKQALEKKG